MRKFSDLTGRRFGNLVVLAKTGEREDRYWTWQCRCDCGREITVNTKRLTRGTVSHCGCARDKIARDTPVPDDLTGRRYGRLTVLRLNRRRDAGQTDWLCQCDCGNQCVVSAKALHSGTRKSCGCLHRKASADGTAADLTNRRFGALTAIAPVRGEAGAFWQCRCACGSEVTVSQENLLQGRSTSCGCVRQSQQETLRDNLTFVDHTCVELLANRKTRTDSKSGFRGVSRGAAGKWLVTIGLQGKRYYVGAYADFACAVKARQHIETALHTGFLASYQDWQSRAAQDADWAAENPFYFHVNKSGGDFHIDTVFGSSVVSPMRADLPGCG